MKERIFQRGDIFYCNLPTQDNECHIQYGYRPVVVVQNDIGNKYSPTLLIVPLTSKRKPNIPTHTIIDSPEANLRYNSTLLCEQIMTINKTDIGGYIGHLSISEEENMNKALVVSMSLNLFLKTSNNPLAAA